MTRTRTWRLIVAVLSSALVLSGCSGAATGDTAATDDSAPSEDAAAGDDAAGGDRADWPETLTFGAVPAAEEGNLEAQYAPMVDALREDLGLEIEFVTATDYAGVIESMIAGQIDLAQFGPFSYVIARNNGAEIEPIAAMVDGPDVEPGYTSYGIVPAGSDITDLAGFEGQDVCFVDPGSTSGFLYPAAGLLELDIDPEADVNATFTGGHDAAAVAVATGQCDAGFAFDAMVDEIAIREGQIEEGDLEVVWESEVIAGSPMAIRTTLPESLKAAIEEVVLTNNGEVLLERGLCTDELTAELEDGSQFCALTDEGVWGYDEVEDSFYDGVRAVCDVTEAPACVGEE